MKPSSLVKINVGLFKIDRHLIITDKITIFDENKKVKKDLN
jgi:hypothetical protein